MLTIPKHFLSLERMSGIATWLVITGSCMYLMLNNTSYSIAYIAGALALCVVFLILWMYVAHESDNKINYRHRIYACVLLFLIIIAIYFVIPYSFVAIFMVIFCALMPYFMPIKRAFLISPLLALPLYLIYTYYWDYSGAGLNAFLFWTFNLFALVMVNTSIKERDARLAVEESNRQLIATQSLLHQAVKQGERVRIARNIHDLLGHHLTALTINLQVASRKTKKEDAELKSTIDQCHQLAKLLLSDVREAVSDIRDKSKIDLAASINAMLNKLPDLQVDLQLDDELQLNDIEVADAIIKCVQESITNTLRHAQGKHISIRIQQSHEAPLSADVSSTSLLQIDIINDGRMPSAIKEGNGLNGMQERISAVKGKIEFLLDKEKFYTRISIPVLQFD